MPAEAPQPPPGNYAETCTADALHWLNVVGHYDHNEAGPDTPDERAKDEVFRYLGDMMARGDLDTAELLSAFEGHARQATSSVEGISDAEAQLTVRTQTFYHFARAMNHYAGRPHDTFKH